jgi:hypothetical protein
LRNLRLSTINAKIYRVVTNVVHIGPSSPLPISPTMPTETFAPNVCQHLVPASDLGDGKPNRIFCHQLATLVEPRPCPGPRFWVDAELLRETWHRLLMWTSGQERSGRLSAQSCSLKGTNVLTRVILEASRERHRTHG